MIELIVQFSDGATAVHPLKDDIVTVGRDTDNAIIIADGSVSRHHAEIKAESGIYTLRDLNSANGTTVNDEPITERIPKDGDVVCFGTIRATWAVRPPPPAPIEPPTLTKIDPPLPKRRRTLVWGTVLLIALPTLFFLGYHLLQAHNRTQEIASASKLKGQKTKIFWDKTHQIEDTGNQQSRSMSFGEYPKLDKGSFDFRWFDNNLFGSFLAKLETRSKSSDEVASEISHLDKSDVDADLLAYTDELCAQWKSASEVDRCYARFISALYKQHQEPERPPNPDEIHALEQQWTTQLNKHRALTTKIIAREVSTSALLTGRYQTAFKP